VVCLANVGLAVFAHDESATEGSTEKTLGLEPPKSLADRLPADAEALCQFVLNQARPWPQFAFEDLLADGCCDQVVRGDRVSSYCSDP
jgi:hypothetical protein